jgi:phospholipase/carboxylesterase
MIENGDLARGPIHLPDNGRGVAAAVVMLHGFASSGNAFEPVIRFFYEALPSAAFYAPNGPKLLGGKLAGRFCWFPLPDVDSDALRRDPHLHAAYYERIACLVEDSAAEVNQFIDRVLAYHALAPNRLALVGFSQGCMISLSVALRRVPPIAAVAGYSGQLIGSRRFMAKPSVALFHGSEDPVIAPSKSEEAFLILGEAGVPVCCQIIPGLKHEMDDRAASQGASFLREALQ